MESLTLIDVAFESDSLLPLSWTPEDAQAQTFETVLKLTPPLIGDDCETPELRQSPTTDSMGRDEREVRTLKQMISEVDPSEELAPPLAVPETTFADELQNQKHEQPSRAPPPESMEKAAPGGAPANSSLLNASAKKKRRIRSARAASNLRKSLAWDKAFLTDEGVLDLDELPLATKAPRKLPDLQALEIPKIWGMPSPLPSSDKVIAEFNAKTPADADRENINFTPAAKPRQPPGKENNSINHGALPVTNLPAKTPLKTPARLDAKASKSDKTRLVPVSQTIKAEELKGTKLRLPSTFTGKKEKVGVPPNLTSEDEKDFLRRCKSSSSVLSPSGSSLSKRVSSVSKKVKNTLGKVLPGGFGGSTRSSSKSPEGPSGSHSSNPAHLSQPLDSIGEDANSPSPPPVSITKSKSSHSILSRGSTEAASNTKKKSATTSVEKSAASEATSTAVTGSELVVSNLKGSSKLRNVGLLMSLCSKAAPSTKKVNEKPSSYFKKVSPVFSRKKSGAAAATTTAPAEDPATEKGSTEPGQPRSKTPASALRLPSPKIGFFDSAKPVSTEHQSMSNSSSENLSRKNQGGGAKPKSGLPSAGRVEQLASNEKNVAVPSGRLLRTGFPSAPHAKSTTKREKGLGATSSAPESPQKHVRGTPLVPGAHDLPITRDAPAEINADDAQNRYCEYDDVVVITELRPSPAPVQDLNASALDHRVQPNARGIPGEDSSPSAGTNMPQTHGSDSRGVGQEADIYRTVDENQSVGVEESLKISPAKQESPTLGCIQAVGHLKEDDEGGSTLSDVIEELSPGSRGLFGSNVIDSVLCREEAASVIEALTSTSWQSDSDKLAAAHEMTNTLLSKKKSATPGAERHQHQAHPLRQRDQTPALESHHSSVDKDTRHQSKSRGSESKTGPHPEVKRRDNGNNEANPAPRSVNEKANNPVMSDCNAEEIVIHDLAEVMKGLGDEDHDDQRAQKLETPPSLEIPSNKSDGDLLRPEDSPKLSTPSSHQAPVDTKAKTDSVEESPSHWSDWSILTGPTKSNAQTPKAATKERASANTPVKSATPKTPPSSKRLSSGNKNVAAESLQNLVDKISTSPSGPAAAFHVTQQTPKSPLAVNVVLLNDVNGRTTAANTPRRQLQVAVDHAAVAESRLYGQENERSGKTSAHVAGNMQKEPQQQQMHGTGKPTTKHRKQVSSQRLDLSDKDDSPTDASFAFSEERLRALEAAGAESFQTKSGAVQHSPPNKTSANTNPWSPVKKPGKQLGPFDCTKKYGHAAAAGH